MAPSRASKPPDVGSCPLADFFWIAGLDGKDVLEAYIKLGDALNPPTRGITPALDEAIVEDEDAEDDYSILESPRPVSRHSKQSSLGRMSRMSGEAQFGARTSNGKNSGTNSNRSSATIRAVPLIEHRVSTLLNDIDFDKAMSKFTTDRESFFLDLNFSAGAVTKAPRIRKRRPKTQKIVPEELQPQPSLSRGLGSIRRHMSIREMSSMKRQPSVARQVSVRTSRRASGYNNVIPIPQPLNESPDMHPLKRKFEPVLLDRYPPKGMPDDSNRRGKFPDFVPMFAFPNDINVVSADTRPRSTWHGFTMTGADNIKLHAICIIMWIPMNPKAAEELEKRCEEWRKANMTDAERELAGSLAERLAAERAKLSRLLARLPYVPSGSEAREELDEDISTVEEKIVMMTDMLRPLRHGAASKIEGLTDGDTGLWIPRAYGVIGRDTTMASFWKEWLRAVVVPMTDGAILRIPPSSPRVGMWQPLERYVVNLCTEAPGPISSKTQTEINIRELRLFARKEAVNELPGSRNTDVYPLFRALTIPNVVVLFEYLLMESRIILLSSHTSMLHLVSKALIELYWPLTWAGVFIPVLPARLVQALEAPCPYICGVERRYDKLEMPDGDFVLVDLDNNEIQSTIAPTALPRQHRRKLMSLLQLAAPHHNKCGVSVGPPLYAMESFPYDSFASENTSIFSSTAQSTNLAKLVSLSSTSFGTQAVAEASRRVPVINVFIQAKSDRSRGGESRPRTASTSRRSNPDSPEPSPISGSFPNLPSTPVSRNDSGYALQSSLREKRSGHFDTNSKRSGSTQRHPVRKASLPFLGHASSASMATLNAEKVPQSSYAPSMYAQSTLAASTIMPHVLHQPVRNSEATSFVEGHCLQWKGDDSRTLCSVCDEKAEDGIYRCSGCGLMSHGRCAPQIYVVCPTAFFPDQVRAAFVRTFASLFYTYRKHMKAVNLEQRKNGMMHSFDMNEFLRGVPGDVAAYLAGLHQTQAFNEFIAERERTPTALTTSSATTSNQASISLFDSVIMSKRNRGGLRPQIASFSGRNPFSSKAVSGPGIDFLHDNTDHLWRLASATSSSMSSRTDFGDDQGRDYRTIVTRIPAKLEEKLMREPKMLLGAPQANKNKRQSTRKPVPMPDLREKLNGLALNAPDINGNYPPSSRGRAAYS